MTDRQLTKRERRMRERYAEADRIALPAVLEDCFGIKPKKLSKKQVRRAALRRIAQELAPEYAKSDARAAAAVAEVVLAKDGSKKPQS